MESQQPSIELQKSIKDNTEALHDFLADLKSWEKEMKAVDEQLSKKARDKNENTNTDTKDSDTPPVRSRYIQGTTSPTKGPAKVANKQGEKTKQTKQAENKQMASSSSKKAKRLPCDYAAWEKFDVDKALESSEEEKEEEEEEKKVERKHPKSPTAGRNPRASKKERASALKEEGNKLYGRGRLEDAVAKYTQGMALDPTNALLPANRAMAYIKLKKFTAAEADCNRCLKLDSNYIKGFLRRATARLGLGKEELARRDYLKVLEMEPHNKEARRGLDELNRPAGSQDEVTRSSTEQQPHTPDINDRLRDTHETARDSAPAKGTTPDRSAPPKDSSPAQNAMPEPPPLETPREGAATGRESERKGNTEMTAIKREGSGKKVKIVEVNSGSTNNASSSSSRSIPAKVPNQIFPIDKPPHLRSKKPLKRIPVKDVASWEEIKKERVEATAAAEGSGSKGGGGDKENKKTEKPTVKPAVPLETTVLVSGKATVPAVPRTSHQFSQDFHRLSRTPDAAFEYLKMISPTFFRTVDLDTNTLVEMTEVLVGDGVPAAEAAQYLSALSVSHGFSIGLMFLEADQKQVFLKLITKCRQVEDHTAKMEELEATVNSL